MEVQLMAFSGITPATGRQAAYSHTISPQNHLMQEPPSDYKQSSE